MAGLVSWIPGAPSLGLLQVAGEKTKYQAAKSNGFFPPRYGGGGKSCADRKGILTTVRSMLGDGAGDAEVVKKSLAKAEILDEIISRESVVLINSWFDDGKGKGDAYKLCLRGELRGKSIRSGYNGANYLNRFPKGTRYGIVRPDLIVFAACTTIVDLENCLLALKAKVEQSKLKG
ncbi:hypothetical protein IFR05_014571 [Cadophora sp. M221]|nr:hypothetical protein IFR05_014571 [Cadophora sp. M221]